MIDANALTIYGQGKKAGETIILTPGQLAFVKGPGAYGLRRQGVDATKAQGIGQDGLKAAGGWSSTKIPNEIYAEART